MTQVLQHQVLQHEDAHQPSHFKRTPRTKHPMRLLLINPRFPESWWSHKWMLSTIMPGQRAINPPLGLATLAALCPPHWHVEIVDENIEPAPLAPPADIIGGCGLR